MNFVNSENFTLLIAAVSFMGGLLFGIHGPFKLKVSRTALEYIASFECDHPGACGRGALCNSCWVRKWAIDLLNKHYGGYKE